MSGLSYEQREKLFEDKKTELHSGAKQFIAAAEWIMDEFTTVVQRPNIDERRQTVEAGDQLAEISFNGESWFSRLSKEDYDTVRSVAEIIIQLSPDIAIGAALQFLQNGYNAEYFETQLADAGFKKIRF